MSTTLGLQHWFAPAVPAPVADPAAELSRHAHEFGFQFVADGVDVKEEPEADLDLDSEPEAAGAGGRYGGVITVRGSGCAGGSEDEKLLRLLGGGDTGDEDDDVDDLEGGGGGQCSVVLDPLPSGVLRSLSCEGRVSATRAQTEVRGLLRDLVEAVAEPPPPPAPALCRKARKRQRRRRSTSAASTSSSGASSSHGRERRHRHRKRERREAAREPSPTPTPRVNPIFVWIKQDDTRIVEVLCEDYDKRNRIRITKTAHGWRAIPHTERLASALGPTASQKQQQSHTVAKQQPLVLPPQAAHTLPARPHASTSSAIGRSEAPRETTESRASPPGGSSGGRAIVAPVAASFVPREEQVDISHRVEDYGAESGAETKQDEERHYDEEEEEEEEEDEEIVREEDDRVLAKEDEDCVAGMEYEEDGHENDAVVDETEMCCDTEEVEEAHEIHSPKTEEVEDDFGDNECYAHGQPEQIHHDCEEEAGLEEETELGIEHEEEQEEDEEEVLPTDLSLPKHRNTDADEEMECKPKRLMISRSPPITIPKYSPSCGLGGPPAERPFPEAQPAHQQPRSTAKSAFLESLLSRKVAASTALDVKPVVGTSTPSGPNTVDIGSRAAAAGSPTVSCSSDERTDRERDDLTLRALLAGGSPQAQPSTTTTVQPPSAPTSTAVDPAVSGRSRLLELLTSEEPAAQLRRLQRDHGDLPDPLLVPRDRLPALLAAPAAEAPRLLASRPELRLPGALASPALLQDPDLLVVPLRQLHAALQQQSHAKDAAQQQPTPQPEFAPLAAFAEWQQRQQQVAAAAAAEASLAQILWLPYLSQLEAASALCGNNADFLAALTAVFPPNGFGAATVPPPPPPPPPPYMMPPSVNAAGIDFKAHLESIAAGIWQQQQQQQQQPHVSTTKTKPQLTKRSPRASPLSQGRPARHHPSSTPANRSPSVTCKSLLNLLSGGGAAAQRRTEPVVPLKVPQPPGAGPIDLSAPAPKLKVKQPQHLVDPTHTPRLLKEPPPECAPVVSSTAVSPGPPAAPDKAGLWHPLFGSQKSYSSPWQWTTVTATGE